MSSKDRGGSWYEDVVQGVWEYPERVEFILVS